MKLGLILEVESFHTENGTPDNSNFSSTGCPEVGVPTFTGGISAGNSPLKYPTKKYIFSRRSTRDIDIIDIALIKLGECHGGYESHTKI